MNSRRLYYILVASVGLLAAGLVGGAYAANNLLRTEARHLLDARSKIMALETQQSQLAKAKKDVEKYEALGAIAKSIVPQDKDQARTVREIVDIAAKAGIKLGSITFPTSTLGSKLPPAAATGGSTPAQPDAASATPTSGVALSQLKPVNGINGVYDLAITVQSDSASPSSYDKLLAFLAGLESNRRTALVSGVTVSPDAKDPNLVSFTLNINEYIKP